MVKNKVDKTSSNKKRVIERTLQLLFLAALAVVIALTIPLYNYYLSVTFPKSNVYGTWVEQNVASYSAEEFVLGPSGVSINGGIVDTEYSFDGAFVEYRVGESVRRFQVLNENFTEMKLISQPHYQPVYRLSEKFKNNIR
ncbi:DUF2850 domain-containing protein [Vibrio sinaloensis]|uniref:DUF2850 domain-containing protein n=1 Tax=Photobacterium sp. (strain ATCC 43367) TaxID=379097 RepID=UPI0035F0C68F